MMPEININREETVIPTDLVFPDEPGVTWCEYKEHLWKDGQEYRVLHMEHRNPETGRLLCIADVLKPVLSPEEYERRRALLEAACAKLLRSAEAKNARTEEDSA